MKNYGEAIEIIKNDKTLCMYRDAWHGVKLGKKMWIHYLSNVNITGNALEIVLEVLFVFRSGEFNYAWTPSQHDMDAKDWIIITLSID